MANLTEIQMLQNQIKELLQENEQLKKENEQLKKQRENGDGSICMCPVCHKFCCEDDEIPPCNRCGNCFSEECYMGCECVFSSDEEEEEEEDDEDYIAECSRCYHRFYEHTDGREFITLICDCGPICKTCLTEKERGQLEEWDEEDWDTELLCQDVEGFRCCVCESVMVTVTKKYNQLNVGEDETEDHPEDNSPHSYCEICDCCVLCECCECKNWHEIIW